MISPVPTLSLTEDREILLTLAVIQHLLWDWVKTSPVPDDHPQA